MNEEHPKLVGAFGQHPINGRTAHAECHSNSARRFATSVHPLREGGFRRIQRLGTTNRLTARTSRLTRRKPTQSDQSGRVEDPRRIRPSLRVVPRRLSGLTPAEVSSAVPVIDGLTTYFDIPALSTTALDNALLAAVGAL